MLFSYYDKCFAYFHFKKILVIFWWTVLNFAILVKQKILFVLPEQNQGHLPLAPHQCLRQVEELALWS